MRGRASLLAALLTLGLPQAPVRAHSLDLTTARVSLRDAHVEVIVELELSLLFARSPTELAALPDAELAAQREQAKRRLESETRLHSDGQRLPVVVTGFPSHEALRAIVVAAASTGEPHGPLLRIRLESPATLPESRQIAIGLPAALGPVVATFLQPTTRFLPAGETSAFTVLAPPSAPPPPRRFGILLLASGLAAACLWVVWRRRYTTYRACQLRPQL